MVPKAVTRFRDIVVGTSHHLTQARERVFMALLNSPKPLSMRELLVLIDGSIDRASVYRNVELLEELGIIHRITIGWKYKLELSDEFIGHHHHLVCLSCGKVIDIEDEQHIDEFTNEVAKKFGFQPRSHQFEIDGYCRECLLRGGSEEAAPAVDIKADRH